MPETSKRKNFDIKHLRRISNTFGTSGSLPVLIPLPWCKNSSVRLGNVYVVGGHGYMLRFMHLQKRNSVHRFRRNTWPPLSPEQLYHAYVAIPYYCPTFAWWTGDWVIAGCDLFIIVSIIYLGGALAHLKITDSNLRSQKIGISPVPGAELRGKWWKFIQIGIILTVSVDHWLSGAVSNQWIWASSTRATWRRYLY